MTTLYDLLGALPGDDADDLRDAFRQAVKGIHPDIRPNDPDAALQFRLVVYAMEVLRDPELRAAYDHLLELARQELVSQQTAAKIRNFAFAVIALAGVFVIAASTYVLLAPVSAVPAQIASSDRSARPALNDKGRDAGTARPAEKQDDFLARWGANESNSKSDPNAETARAAEGKNDLPLPSGTSDHIAPADHDAPIATPAKPRDDPPARSSANDTDAPADRSAETATEMKEQEPPMVQPSGPTPPARHDDANDPKALAEPHDGIDASAVMHAKAIVAYRNGDLSLALADLNRAIALDPTFILAYMNRGIVLYRMGKLDLALADVARAKRIDRAGHAGSMAAFHRKRRHDASLIENPAMMDAAGL